MSINIEAHFEKEALANLTVDRLRQSGILFDIIDLKPAAARWKTGENMVNEAFSIAPEKFVAEASVGMPFEHMCARAYMSSGGAVNEIKRDTSTSMVLRLKVSEKSLGKAEKIVRNNHGYSLKIFN